MGPREACKLEIVKSLKQNWDKARPNGLAEQFIADALNFDVKNRQAGLWYIVCILWVALHLSRRPKYGIIENVIRG